MANIPVVNLGERYLNGLLLSRVDDENVAITSGQCRDENNIIDMVADAALNADISANGANGLDTGAAANNTMYAVYVIGDSSKKEPVACLLSTSFSAPVMPAGYDSKRRVGAVLTDGTADILEFHQRGLGRDRWMYYDVAVASDVTNGSSATFAAVDLSAGIPNIAAQDGIADLLCLFTPTAGDDTLELRPGNSSATDGLIRASGAVAAVAETVNLIAPYDTAGVDYKVTGSAVAISVAGYLDTL